MSPKLFLIGFVTAMFCVGCEQPVTQVKFIVPDGYTGPLVMRLHQPDGAELRVRDRTYIVDYPESGELPVEGDPLGDAFREWRACYQNGDQLPIEHFIDEAQPDKVALFPLFTTGVGDEARSFMYVGTPEEAEEWLSEWFFSP